MQRILNIALEFYTPKTTGICVSICYVYDQNLITRDEYVRAKDEISNYMDELSPKYYHAFLTNALKEVGLPHEYEDRLAIFKDWENRPKPWLEK